MPLYGGDSSRYQSYGSYAYSPSSAGHARSAQAVANSRSGSSSRSYSNYNDLARSEYGHHDSIGQHRNDCHSRHFGGGFAAQGEYARYESNSRGGDRLTQEASSGRRGSSSDYAFSPDSYGASGIRPSSSYRNHEESSARVRGGQYDRYFGGHDSGFAPLSSYSGSGSRARDGQGYYSNYGELASREYGHHDSYGRSSGGAYDRYFGGRDSGFAPEGSYSTCGSGVSDRLAQEASAARRRGSDRH